MIAAPWRQPPLTQAQIDDLFMLTLDDDTEDAPWMVMGDLQFWSASGFAHSLRAYAHRRRLPWYVASMLPIRYTWPPSARKRQLAPDVFVAFVPEHARGSYDVSVEGSFPPFMLEVVSPSSVARDEQEKLLAYQLLGAQEYVLFTPRDAGQSTLAGYRRNAAGLFEPWIADEQGGLWSDVLALRLVALEGFLQAWTAEGEVLLTLEQAEIARVEAEAARETEARARQQAEAARETEARARQQAEAEVARLRQELDRLNKG
jgi:Uma2 family endonuclease